jgi:hypothetical protein
MRYLLVVTFSLLTTCANAQFFTGNKMLEVCGKPNRTPISTYLAGVMDKGSVDWAGLMGMRDGTAKFEKREDVKKGITSTLDLVADSTKPYCVPKNATLGQATDVFCKYLLENPKDRNESASYLADQAFRDGWPCRIRGGAGD